MKTFTKFAEELRLDIVAAKNEAEIKEFLGLWGKAKPTKPEGFAPIKKGQKDSPHYRTDHHYGHGDIEPSTIPIFKPTWQNAR